MLYIRFILIVLSNCLPITIYIAPTFLPLLCWVWSCFRSTFGWLTLYNNDRTRAKQKKDERSAHSRTFSLCTPHSRYECMHCRCLVAGVVVSVRAAPHFIQLCDLSWAFVILLRFFRSCAEQAQFGWRFFAICIIFSTSSIVSTVGACSLVRSLNFHLVLVVAF